MSSATTARPEAADRSGPADDRARSTGRSSGVLRRVVPIAVLVVLVGAMLVDTTFLSPDEAKSLNPPDFSAAAYAAEEFPRITQRFTADATPLDQLVPALEADPAAAAQQFGGTNVSGKFSFPVSITAEVDEVDENFMLLRTPDLPPGTEVRVPVGVALNGTPIRDAAGIEFADFEGQTDYQAAANEFKLIMESNVVGPLDVTTLTGKTVDVVGAYATGGPPRSYIVQPVSLAVGS